MVSLVGFYQWKLLLSCVSGVTQTWRQGQGVHLAFSPISQGGGRERGLVWSVSLKCMPFIFMTFPTASCLRPTVLVTSNRNPSPSHCRQKETWSTHPPETARNSGAANSQNDPIHPMLEVPTPSLWVVKRLTPRGTDPDGKLALQPRPADPEPGLGSSAGGNTTELTANDFGSRGTCANRINTNRFPSSSPTAGW